jgi:hypothetical protein
MFPRTPPVVLFLGLLLMLSSCDSEYHLYLVNKGSSDCAIRAWPEMDAAFFPKGTSILRDTLGTYVRLVAGDSIEACRGLFRPTLDRLCLDSLHVQPVEGALIRWYKATMAPRCYYLTKGRFFRRSYALHVQ